MASGIPTLCCWVFIACFCSKVIQGERAFDCCLSVSTTKIPQFLVRGYMRQGDECNIHAIIFITRKGRKLCAPTEPAWVKKLTNILDNQLEVCKANHFKGKRCNSLKFDN